MSTSLLNLDELQRQLEGALVGSDAKSVFVEAVVVCVLNLAKGTRSAIDAVEHAHEDQLRALLVRVDRLEQTASAARKELAALTRRAVA